MAEVREDRWVDRILGVGVGAVAPYLYRGANHVINRFSDDVSPRVVKKVDELTDRAAQKFIDRFSLLERNVHVTRSRKRRRTAASNVGLGDSQQFHIVNSVPEQYVRATRTHRFGETLPPEELKDMIEEIPINKGGYRVEQSFYKMPKRFKRRGKYRRGRRRSKVMTKRGVKALIQRNAQFAGSWNKYRKGKAFYLNSSYGNHAVSEMDFNNISHMTTDYVNYIAKIANFQPGTGGVDQPQFGNKYQAKGGKVKLMLHNPLTEIVIATFWWIRPKGMENDTPSSVWQTEWAQYAPATASVYNKTFSQDFQTYPTEFPEWKKRFDIVQKYNVVFRPGDYRELYLKLPSFTFDYQEQSGFNFNSNTRHLMIQLKGIPTMQNLGTGDPTNVNYTLTHLEMIYELEYQLVPLATTATSFLASRIERGTVTAGKSLIPENTSSITIV